MNQKHIEAAQALLTKAVKAKIEAERQGNRAEAKWQTWKADCWARTMAKIQAKMEVRDV